MKRDTKLTVLSLGGWYVGNSAVLDWLDSFSSFYYLKGDFHDLRKCGGVYDCILESNLDKKVGYINNEIRHFSKGLLRPSKAFINKILFNKKANHASLFNYNTHMLTSYFLFKNKCNNLDFNQLEFWEERLKNLLKLAKGREENLVLQNPIYYDDISPEHKRIWRGLFIEPKMFFVHRDPIDQFVQIYLANDLAYGNTKFRAGTEGMNQVERFFCISKRTYLSRLKMLKDYSPEQLGVISFEKFAYANLNEQNRIKLFFNIDHNCKTTKKFDFDRTKGNVELGKINPAICKLLDGYSEQLKELYALREQLITSSHSLI